MYQKYCSLTVAAQLHQEPWERDQEVWNVPEVLLSHCCSTTSPRATRKRSRSLECTRSIALSLLQHNFTKSHEKEIKKFGMYQKYCSLTVAAQLHQEPRERDQEVWNVPEVLLSHCCSTTLPRAMRKRSRSLECTRSIALSLLQHNFTKSHEKEIKKFGMYQKYCTLTVAAQLYQEPRERDQEVWNVPEVLHSHCCSTTSPRATRKRSRSLECTRSIALSLLQHNFTKSHEKEIKKFGMYQKYCSLTVAAQLYQEPRERDQEVWNVPEVLLSHCCSTTSPRATRKRSRSLECTRSIALSLLQHNFTKSHEKEIKKFGMYQKYCSLSVAAQLHQEPWERDQEVWNVPEVLLSHCCSTTSPRATRKRSRSLECTRSIALSLLQHNFTKSHEKEIKKFGMYQKYCSLTVAAQLHQEPRERDQEVWNVPEVLLSHCCSTTSPRAMRKRSRSLECTRSIALSLLQHNFTKSHEKEIKMFGMYQKYCSLSVAAQLYQEPRERDQEVWNVPEVLLSHCCSTTSPRSMRKRSRSLACTRSIALSLLQHNFTKSHEKEIKKFGMYQKYCSLTVAAQLYQEPRERDQEVWNVPEVLLSHCCSTTSPRATRKRSRSLECTRSIALSLLQHNFTKKNEKEIKMFGMYQKYCSLSVAAQLYQEPWERDQEVWNVPEVLLSLCCSTTLPRAMRKRSRSLECTRSIALSLLQHNFTKKHEKEIKKFGMYQKYCSLSVAAQLHQVARERDQEVWNVPEVLLSLCCSTTLPRSMRKRSRSLECTRSIALSLLQHNFTKSHEKEIKKFGMYQKYCSLTVAAQLHQEPWERDQEVWNVPEVLLSHCCSTTLPRAMRKRSRSLECTRSIALSLLQHNFTKSHEKEIKKVGMYQKYCSLTVAAQLHQEPRERDQEVWNVPEVLLSHCCSTTSPRAMRKRSRSLECTRSIALSLLQHNFTKSHEKEIKKFGMYQKYCSLTVAAQLYQEPRERDQEVWNVPEVLLSHCCSTTSPRATRKRSRSLECTRSIALSLLQHNFTKSHEKEIKKFGMYQKYCSLTVAAQLYQEPRERDQEVWNVPEVLLSHCCSTTLPRATRKRSRSLECTRSIALSLLQHNFTKSHEKEIKKFGMSRLALGLKFV